MKVVLFLLNHAFYIYIINLNAEYHESLDGD